MIDWATDIIDAIGLVGVAALVALESIFPPIPSELVLLLTGFNVSEARFGLVPAILAATVGSLVGAWVLYGVGRLVEESRLEALLAGAGRFLGFKRSDVHKGFEWFSRHGNLVVFFGRLVPIVRSVVSIPAGADKMPLLRFSAWTATGSLVWNTAWIVAGRALGDQWQDAENWGSRFQYVAVAAGVVVVVVLAVRARRNRARQRAERLGVGP